MKRILFEKATRDGKKEKAEGYAYKTTNGINVALHKEGKAWYATEVTSGKLATLDYNLTLKDVKAELEKNSPTILKLLRKEQTAESPESKKEQKKMKKAVKANKIKKVRPNPFASAEVQDVYLTKNKIAVTTVREQRKNNVNKTIVKTKYYEQNDLNMRRLRKVQKEVRRGRNGSKYEQL